ncbi:hypothetical protein Lalb_Chr25g0289681 [Lupinus albus]|uniref:Uncharacterized protein n=1 Tax=Lupinus albus TaxID=3870 RepID=A0A6A4NFR6_LUPAL|nr:hypothetical protein Lalb_Chr25g0289681 [Lupinus albus]
MRGCIEHEIWLNALFYFVETIYIVLLFSLPRISFFLDFFFLVVFSLAYVINST